ncbi:MAG: IPT/TIG domain-containing protein [Candidatus Omnitrophica bacterium]|nr:IPT/TIG domain-containing protein [Candidatus Omnitrophota bacterium]
MSSRLQFLSALAAVTLCFQLGNSVFAQAPTQNLFETTGTIPAQSGQFSGGSRQTVDYGPISVPRSGRLTFIVTSTPNVRQEVQNIERHDSTVQTITFNGQEISLRPDYPECNAFGSNPAICTSVWDPPTSGSLSIELLGPATYNTFGEFSGHAAQNYTLTVNFQPGPDITNVVPDEGSLGGWETVTVNGNYFEEDSVVLFGGVAATDTVVLSPTQIVCKTPPCIAGATDVTVLAPDPIEARWNYGRPWGVFTTLPGGFTYTAAKTRGPAQSTERLLGTYSGFFEEQANVNADPESKQQFEDFNFNIPGAGRLRWEAWAFIPITSPVFGGPGDELNFEAFNDSTAVRGFRRGDGNLAGTNVTCTSLTYFYAPVICNSTRIVDVTGSGAGEFTVSGPARISANFNDFLSAPFQDWSLALYFADQPVVDSVSPDTGPPAGGTSVTIAGAHFGSGARVYFGEEEANNVAVLDSNTITCTAPMADPGSVDVSVELFTNLRGTLKDGFVYGELTPTETQTPTPSNTPTATSTPTPTLSPTATPSMEPPPTFNVDPVDDDIVNEEDLLVIIISIRGNDVDPEILFQLSNLWKDLIGS